MKRAYISVLITILLILSATYVVLAQESKESTEKAEKDQVVATYDGKELTMSELEFVVQYRMPRDQRFFGVPDLNMLSADHLKVLTESVIAEELIYEKAMKEKFELSEEAKERIARAKEQLAVRELYRMEIEDKVSEITEEEARKIYQDNLDMYTRPFKFDLKQILLLKFEKYTVKEGDTLESIAKKISGDVSKIEDIRKADTFEPRYVKPEDREKILFEPLREGEELLVPMSKEKKEEVYKKIQEIHKGLQEGADFDDFVEKFSEVKVSKKVVPSQVDPPPHLALIEAAKKTAEGEFSDVFETEVGYRIIKILSKEEKQIIPFEQVKENIILRETSQKRNEYAADYLMNLVKSSNLVKTYPKVLGDDKASTSAVVAEVGDVKITKEEFLKQLERYVANLPTPEEKLDELYRLADVRRIVLPAEAEKKDMDEKETFKEAFEELKIQLVADAYLRNLYDKEIKVADEALQKYYEENIERYTIPRMYKVRQIMKRVHPEFSNLSDSEQEKVREKRLEEMKKIREKIKSAEDFARMAEEYSEDPGTRNKGGDLGYVPESYRGGFDGKIKDMKAGDISEPFIMGAFAYLIMVEDVKEPEKQPFEEVKTRVERAWLTSQQQQIKKNLEETVLEEANVKITLPEKSEEGETQ